MRADILKFVAVRIVIIVAIVAGLEFAFRHGAWEWMAKRESNAGQTIAMKRALEALGPGKLDFVTFGDSRTVYGLDHERIAAAAKAKGLTHASVAIPGMHWMSMEMLVRWLRERAPQLKGAVIATTISDFKFLGNGTYELNMVAPFSRAWDADWMSRHVPLDHTNLSTYGSWSALFLYREDIQDLVRYPARRIRDAGALLAKAPAGSTLFSRQKVATDICQVPLTSVAACAATPPVQPFAGTVMQCRQWQRETRMDFRESAKFPHLTEVARVRETQFRELPYAKPVVVLLMPMPEIWRREAMPLGAEAWARTLLQSLQDKGLIELHDFTDFFGGSNGPECAAFWDLYHQNTIGQDKLTDVVLPILEQRLYVGKSGSPSVPTPK